MLESEACLRTFDVHGSKRLGIAAHGLGEVRFEL